MWMHGADWCSVACNVNVRHCMYNVKEGSDEGGEGAACRIGGENTRLV